MNTRGTHVDIDNCDREPIHVPGAIQPHRALLVLGSELEVREVSDNVAGVLGIEPARLFGAPIEQVLDSTAAEQIRKNQGVRSWQRFNPLAAEVGGRRFDAIVHRSNHGLVIELEPTDLVPQATYRDYGADTHQAMMRIQGAESLAELLQRAAEVVRWVTGYDRVMVYRFSKEGHGQVVAEEREPALEPFLGLHYPASDIPAQARRLYLLNWLRIIRDVDYRRAELLLAPGVEEKAPLDLTYATLRSVSPIHIEYLRNMGVGASMSVSLVHDDKLWGLVACHHYSPRFVPYSVRMTCELLGQMLSTLILSWRLKEEAARKEAIGARRVRLMERLTRADYIAGGLTEAPDDLLALAGAEGAAILEDGRCTRVGQCPSEERVRAFAGWMAEHKHEVFASRSMAVEFPSAPALGDEVAGVLGLGLPQTEANAVLWFRPAIERTVSWAGNPEKTYSEGPNGPRLNPRGSFKLWQETVKNQSEPWSELEVGAAAELRAGLTDVMIRKVREAEHARDMLLGMVSHDLRNPLGAIQLAAEMLQTGEPEASSVTRVSARIAASSDRMRRMVEQLLDYTRAQAGSLQLNPAPIDLVTLCRQLAEEIEGAHPGFRVELDLPEACPFQCDPERIAQVISNLLGNSRHHGDPARPASLALRCGETEVEIEVKNHGAPIPPDRIASIFEPFKRAREMARSSKYSGLGLGLFIVKRVVEMHEGHVRITSSEEGETTCTVTLPKASRSSP